MPHGVSRTVSRLESCRTMASSTGSASPETTDRAAEIARDASDACMLVQPLRSPDVLALRDLGEYDGGVAVVPRRREPDGGAGARRGSAEHGQLEAVVAQHGGGIVGDELEAVDGHAL